MLLRRCFRRLRDRPRGLHTPLAVLAALVTTGHIQGCASARVREIEVCLPDPRNSALQCTSKDGVSYTRPFDVSAEEYVCLPAKEFGDYMKGCR